MEPRLTWLNQMTFPCELTLRKGPEGIRLHREPIADIQRLRADPQVWRNLNVPPGQNPLNGIHGDTLEIHLEAELAGMSAFTMEIRGEAVRYSVQDHRLEAGGVNVVVQPSPASAPSTAG